MKPPIPAGERERVRRLREERLSVSHCMSTFHHFYSQSQNKQKEKKREKERRGLDEEALPTKSTEMREAAMQARKP